MFIGLNLFLLLLENTVKTQRIAFSSHLINFQSHFLNFNPKPLIYFLLSCCIFFRERVELFSNTQYLTNDSIHLIVDILMQHFLDYLRQSISNLLDND